MVVHIFSGQDVRIEQKGGFIISFSWTGTIDISVR